MKALITEAERRISSSKLETTKDNWIIFSTYCIVTYVVSLRGNEGFLLDIEGLIRHWSTTQEEHVYLALHGKFKGEANDLDHILPCASTITSKLPVRKAIERLIAVKKKAGFVDGPAISDIEGNQFSVKDIDQMLVSCLSFIYEKDKSLFPTDIRTFIEQDEEDMRMVFERYYSCFRTFRRSSDSRALENRHMLHDEDIDIVNRWRRVEDAKGNRPSHVMKQHYADVDVLLKPFLRYTKVM